MATVSFYIRHVLRNEEKIEEVLEALNNPDIGISISEEEVRKTMQELEKGEDILNQWIDQYLLSKD